MKLTKAIAALCLAAAIATPSTAQETAAPHRLLPDSLNLEIVDGSVVPEDCHYPSSITDAARFEIACVTMPRVIGAEISSQYIGQLGAAGWHQGNYVPGGLTAVRTDENNCQRVLNIFPSDYPPSEEQSAVTVLWFALDREPRCNGAQPG
ncbi:MAG: hypothetical protein R3C30_07950 [Hyphomonadaceae bacterium]